VDEIIEIAKRECKGQATDEEIAYLNRPEMHSEWLNALVTALNELDSQMTYHRDRVTMLANDVNLNLVGNGEYKYEKEKFDSWQRKALRYKAGIQKRITEVKSIVSSDGSSSRAEELIDAIILHRQQSENAGLTPEPHDLELWSSIAR